MKDCKIEKNIKVSEKLYFNVYQKYLNTLGEEGTESIDIDLDENTNKFLEEKANKFGVSVNTIIAGYLEMLVHRNDK